MIYIQLLILLYYLCLFIFIYLIGTLIIKEIQKENKGIMHDIIFII